MLEVTQGHDLDNKVKVKVIEAVSPITIYLQLTFLIKRV